jgi:hypothetical protein
MSDADDAWASIMHRDPVRSNPKSAWNSLKILISQLVPQVWLSTLPSSHLSSSKCERTTYALFDSLYKYLPPREANQSTHFNTSPPKSMAHQTKTIPSVLNPRGSNSGSLSSAAKAGIGIAITTPILLLCIIAVVFIWRRRGRLLADFDEEAYIKELTDSMPQNASNDRRSRDYTQLCGESNTHVQQTEADNNAMDNDRPPQLAMPVFGARFGLDSVGFSGSGVRRPGHSLKFARKWPR